MTIDSVLGEAGNSISSIPGAPDIGGGFGPGGAAPGGGGGGGGAANNGQQPNKKGCGKDITLGAISVGLDILGAIPGLGNAVSAMSASGRIAVGVYNYGSAAYGIGTGLADESPVGAVSAGTGLGLTVADAALEGGKVIPVVGNLLSAGTAFYDSYQLGKTVGRCW